MVMRIIEKPSGEKIRQEVTEGGIVLAQQKIDKSGKHGSWEQINSKPPAGYSEGYTSFSQASAEQGTRTKTTYDESERITSRTVIDKKTGKVLWKDVAGGASGAVLTNVIGQSRRIGGITSKDIKSIMATGKETAFYEEYEKGKPAWKVEQKILRKLETKQLMKLGGSFVAVTPIEKELKYTRFKNGREIPVGERKIMDTEIRGRGDRNFLISGLVQLLGKPRAEVEKMVKVTKEVAKRTMPNNPEGKISVEDVIATANAIANEEEGLKAEMGVTKKGVWGTLTPTQKMAMHATTVISPKFLEYIKSLAPGGATPQEIVLAGMEIGKPATQEEILIMARQRADAYKIYEKNKVPAHLASIFSPKMWDYVMSGAIPGGRTPRDVAIEGIRQYSVEPARTGKKQKFLPFLAQSPAFQIPAFYAGGAILGSASSPVIGRLAKSPKVARVAGSGLFRYGVPATMGGLMLPGAYLDYSFNVQAGMSKKEALERVVAKFGGEVANMVALGVGFEKGLKAGFPIKRKKLTTPKGKTFADALVLEYAQPEGAVKLFGKVSQVTPEELIGYEVGASPFEARTVRKILSRSLPADELIKLEFHQKYGGQLKGVKSKFTDPSLIKYGTERMSSEAVEVTLKIIKKEPHLIYGSQAGRAMHPELLGRRAIHDIDIMIFKDVDKVMRVAKNVQRELESLGLKTKIEQPTPGAFKIYTQQPSGQYAKALEIFSHETAYGAGVPAGGWGYSYGLRPTRLQGLKTMSSGEHLLRKGGSILTIQKGGFAPQAHRTKDIVDYILTAKGQIASMEARPLMSVAKSKLIKAMKTDIRKLQKAWGVTDEMLRSGEFILGANLPHVEMPTIGFPPAPATMTSRLSRPATQPRYQMARASRFASDPLQSSANRISRGLEMAQGAYVTKGRRPSKPSRPSRPSRPSYPSYPYPMYPSYPSRPSKPSKPSRPSRQSYPSPGSYAYYMLENMFSRPSRPSKPSKQSPPGSKPPSAPSYPSPSGYYPAGFPMMFPPNAPPGMMGKQRARKYKRTYISERERVRRIMMKLFGGY